MANAITSIVQSQAREVAKKLKHPRRAVDDQGRSVQYPHSKAQTVGMVFFVVGAVLMLLLALVLLAGGEYEGAIVCGVMALIYFLCIFLIFPITKAWYYEDEYGFELLTPYLHKKVSMSYNEIASWEFNQQRGLILKTNDKKKAAVSLPFYRPLILLNTLVTMEIEGRFGQRSEAERNQAIWTLDSEFCEHANKVVEEMQKTGATIYIPER